MADPRKALLFTLPDAIRLAVVNSVSVFLRSEDTDYSPETL